MISYPLTPPATPGPVEVSWNQLTVTAESRSPFTLASQIFAWPGQQLGAVVTMPIMRAADWKAWRAFFAALRGREGTFIWGDHARFCKQETGLGMPETVGVSQGRNVVSTGWTPNVEILQAGDWLQIGGKLRQVMQATVSDESGNATFAVWPDLQAVLDATEIVWREPKGTFRLSQAAPEFITRLDGYQEGFTFTIEEVA